MAMLLPHLIKALWRARVEEFFLTFAVLTALVALVTAMAVGQGAKTQSETDSAGAPKPKGELTSGAIAALGFMVLCIAGYIVEAVKWEAFTDYDDALWTLFTLRGVNLHPTIWPVNGRFFPLGHTEFNWVGHFAHTAAGYHAFPILQLVIVCLLVLFMDRSLSLTARAMMAAMVPILPSIVTSYGGLPFPDRNVVFYLALLIFCIVRFERRGAVGWAVGAAVSAMVIVFYKETAFLMIAGLAAARLVLRCRREEGRGWDWKLLRSRESRLDLCLACVAAVFFLYYASVMMVHPSMGYAADNRVSWGKDLRYYFTFDLLAVAFVVAALVRGWQVLRRRATPELLWDGLACGGVVCFLAYVYLRLCRPYYLAPVDLIALLFLVRMVARNRAAWRAPARPAASALAVAVVLQCVAFSGFRVYERENTVRAKAELGDAVVAAVRGSGHAVRLYFPFGSDYTITEFASYLIYRGLRVEGGEGGMPTTDPEVILVSRAFDHDKPCVDYRAFVCHAGAVPLPGELVVELPDDHATEAEMEANRTGGQQIFTYEPAPRVPHGLLSRLRIASLQWQFTVLPDRWLRASLTEQKRHP